MTGIYVPEKWDRASFYNKAGEPSIIGVVVAVEIIEGQYLFRVLEEQRDEEVDRVWEEGNPFGLKQHWDWEAVEFLGKVSYEELLTSSDEIIRDFAKQHAEELQKISSPNEEELKTYSSYQDFKKRVMEASDEELDSLIDSL